MFFLSASVGILVVIFWIRSFCGACNSSGRNSSKAPERTSHLLRILRLGGSFSRSNVLLSDPGWFTRSHVWGQRQEHPCRRPYDESGAVEVSKLDWLRRSRTVLPLLSCWSGISIARAAKHSNNQIFTALRCFEGMGSGAPGPLKQSEKMLNVVQSRIYHRLVVRPAPIVVCVSGPRHVLPRLTDRGNARKGETKTLEAILAGEVFFSAPQ